MTTIEMKMNEKKKKKKKKTATDTRLSFLSICWLHDIKKPYNFSFLETIL